MIQIINCDYSFKYKLKDNKNIEINGLSEYKSLDMFEYNIINLSNSDLWKCINKIPAGINKESDLKPLMESIRSSNSNILIVLPQNIIFQYNYESYSKKYSSGKEIKNYTSIIKKVINDNVFSFDGDLAFEKCETSIGNFKYKSDFYFKTNYVSEVFKSDSSRKLNTILSDNVAITTINLFDSECDQLYDLIDNFIKSIFIKSESIPDWINDVKILNDEELILERNKIVEEIEKMKERLDLNLLEYKNNLEYKAILFSTGKELESRVIKILSEIFEINSDFKDVYEEDFRFNYNDMTFLIETKGLNNEVTGHNVQDAITHKVIYDDKNEENGIEENTKVIFIVAYERKKRIEERKIINNRQITIAKRNDCLIIPSDIMLKMYDDFKKGKIDRSKIYDILKQQKGLIVYK